jgi:hypothetical protein
MNITNLRKLIKYIQDNQPDSIGVKPEFYQMIIDGLKDVSGVIEQNKQLTDCNIQTRQILLQFASEVLEQNPHHQTAKLILNKPENTNHDTIKNR